MERFREHMKIDRNAIFQLLEEGKKVTRKQILDILERAEKKERISHLDIARLLYIEDEDLIEKMFEVAGIETEIIAASVRNPIHVTDCALAGADIATVPYAVIEQMTHHPLTDAGIEKFKKDYIAVFGE